MKDMSRFPRIGFDTSAINALEVDDENVEQLMVALRCGFEVRVSGINIDEIIATHDAQDREALVQRCVRLLAGGQCLWPHHWITRLLIRGYLSNREAFDWQQVNIRAQALEQALIRRNYTDQVCEEQRKLQFASEEKYKRNWNALRPRLAPILKKLKSSQKPVSYSQAARIAEMTGGVLWGIGAEIFRSETGISLSDDEVSDFMNACPPFRALCYAGVGSWYDRALGPTHKKRAKIGRNDTMMACYLPYCDKFIARDWPQVNRFREIAALADIKCEVLSYHEFRESFYLIPV